MRMPKISMSLILVTLEAPHDEKPCPPQQYVLLQLKGGDPLSRPLSRKSRRAQVVTGWEVKLGTLGPSGINRQQ